MFFGIFDGAIQKGNLKLGEIDQNFKMEPLPLRYTRCPKVSAHEKCFIAPTRMMGQRGGLTETENLYSIPDTTFHLKVSYFVGIELTLAHVS